MGYTYNLWHGVQEHKTFAKQIFAGVIALLFTGSIVAAVTTSAATTTVVTGNSYSTVTGEGWLFNRDVNNVTPYEFNNNEASIGSGSVEIAPIGTNPSDKFIAEYFQQIDVNEFQSLAYDFKIAGNGTVADANDFYLNVYVNIDNSSNYYDCRFDFVPDAGSTATFTEFSIQNDITADAVAKRGSRIPTACPSTIAEMPVGSHIRAIAINLGQSNNSDTGLGGYFDKVQLTVSGDTTIFDFEAPLAPTNKDECKNGNWQNFQTTYKNQGHCVASVVASDNSKLKRD